MFRKIVLLVAAVAAMASVPAFAAEQGDIQITLNAGVAMPMGDFGDAANLGFLGGVGFDWFATPNVAIGASGGYLMLSGSDDFNAFLTTNATDPVEAKFSAIMGGAHAKFYFGAGNGSAVSPYVIGGVGVYNFKTTLESNDPAFNGDASDTNFGGRAGLGAKFGGNGQVGFGAEAAFHHIATEGDATQMITIAATLNFGMNR